jgi:hypothetical protein
VVTQSLALTQSASALASCTHTFNLANTAQWAPTGGQTTGGVEAPIQVRRDGLACDASPKNYAGASAWIGIESGDLSELIQGGIIRYYDTNLATTRICLFLEVLPAPPDPYACGTSVPDNDVFEYFRIQQQSSYYDLYDCGTSDPSYTACGLPLVTLPIFSTSDFVLAAGENDIGSCTLVHEMGSSTPNGPNDPDNFGTATNPIKIQPTGGSWAPRTLTTLIAGLCPNEQSALLNSNENFSVWDTANAS